ncbi:restriction endonuclease subunit S [Streptosporangium nondiastaticum]|uniref:Restriction endonuclease subunit S n=1 Tax=Streptosporangium nondiastaticum TaxID=35764 RepID=A0A9X7JLR4_9ACTN|nr:restriction endonuclease subunit S [Streptosporangium nondiastaticum]PSJ26040.1 restriction endonuclease subunit S [Streptosporangium nondiastaticum]
MTTDSGVGPGGSGSEGDVADAGGLPAGWGRATLGELCQPIEKALPTELGRSTFQYIDIGSVDPSTLSVVRAVETEADAAPSRARQLLRHGDTVFSTVRPYLRKIAWIPEEFDGEIASTGFCVLRAGEAIDRRFLFHLVSSSSFISRVVEKQRGVSYPAVRERDVLEIEVPVPPLAEQHRIVAKLDEQLANIATGMVAVQAALTSSDVLKHQITGGGACGGFDGIDRFPALIEPADVDDGTLPDLPAGWQWRRLEEIADVVGGVTKDSKKQSNPEYVEVPYLRVANVQRGQILLDRVETIRVPAKKAESLKLEVGDVLLNEGGDRDKLGRGWVWEGQIENCIHQNHVFRARITGDALDPRLLAWHANAFGKNWCDRNGKQTVNLASISLRRIKLLPIPVPPRSVQEDLVKSIESRLAEVEAARQMAQEVSRQGENLRGALLHAAFTGSLVAQDPDDEPASALLDRIRAQRAAGSKPARRKRASRTTAPAAPQASGRPVPSGTQETLPL